MSASASFRSGRALALFGAAFAAVLPTLMGCPPSGLGRTCRFRGDTTACGACIAKACQAEIDACCDGYCAESLEALDTCATGGGCAALESASSTIAKCVAASCGETCGGVDAGLTGPTCATRADGSCLCESGGTGGSSLDACRPSSFPGGDAICCAASAWPAVGEKCLCVPVRCVASTSDPDDCLCGLYEENSSYEEVGRCMAGSSSVCCKAPDGTCRCGVTSCPPSDEELASCSPSDVTLSCSDGDKSVSACL